MAEGDALIKEVEEKIAALNLKLPTLEGKANKKERQQVSKDIYALENDEQYLAAVKAKLSDSRAAAAAADDVAHAEKLKKEAEEEVKRIEAAAAAAAAKKAAGPVDVTDDGEVHMSTELLKKGDSVTIPVDGDKVALLYEGKFADGTWDVTGEDLSGKIFDSTLRKKGKGKSVQEPLPFVLGQGKAIRAWEEAVRTMSLGEKLILTAEPKWAYRKAGLQDPDSGKYIVPPNATLKFEMQLVQVRDKSLP